MIKNHSYKKVRLMRVVEIKYDNRFILEFFKSKKEIKKDKRKNYLTYYSTCNSWF